MFTRHVGRKSNQCPGATANVPNLTVYFFSVNRVLSRETTSAARLLSRIVRRAVSRAPSTFGGSSSSMRRQVLALMTTPVRDSFSSFAIDSVIRPSVVILRDEPVSGRSSGSVNEFSAELISGSSLPTGRWYCPLHDCVSPAHIRPPWRPILPVMRITCLERNIRDRYVLAQFFEWLLRDVIGLSRIGDKAL